MSWYTWALGLTFTTNKNLFSNDNTETAIYGLQEGLLFVLCFFAQNTKKRDVLLLRSKMFLYSVQEHLMERLKWFEIPVNKVMKGVLTMFKYRRAGEEVYQEVKCMSM